MQKKGPDRREFVLSDRCFVLVAQAVGENFAELWRCNKKQGKREGTFSHPEKIGL